MHRAYFITGTDTGVGKTHVVISLAKQLRSSRHEVGIYKPACSGADESPIGPVWADVAYAWDVLGGKYSQDQICPQRFLAPLAPPEAARLEQRFVDRDLLLRGFRDWQQTLAKSPSSLLLVEGAGGWLSPLAEGETNADLAADLNLPVIVVAANRLGVINHTLLTIESIRSRGLNVEGVILNQLAMKPDESAASNARHIEQLGHIKVVAEVAYCGEVPLLDQFLPPDFHRLD